MSTIDRDTVIEQAVHAYWSNVEKSTSPREQMSAALPVIAKALLAPLRELHTEIVVNGSRCCDNCDGNGYPCPTVRMLDAIEAEVSP